MYVMAASTVPPFVGLLALSLLPNTPEYKWTKWGMYFITVPYVLALFLAWTLSQSNLTNTCFVQLIASFSSFERRRPHQENNHLLSNILRILRGEHVR